MRAESPQCWFVYLLLCGDQSLYAGITTEPARRLSQHQSGKGARYTRSRGALRLVWLQEVEGQSEALVLEAALKRQTRLTKLRLGGLR